MRLEQDSDRSLHQPGFARVEHGNLGGVVTAIVDDRDAAKGPGDLKRRPTPRKLSSASLICGNGIENSSAAATAASALRTLVMSWQRQPHLALNHPRIDTVKQTQPPHGEWRRLVLALAETP